MPLGGRAQYLLFEVVRRGNVCVHGQDLTSGKNDPHTVGQYHSYDPYEHMDSTAGGYLYLSGFFVKGKEGEDDL